jgi:hypothetical protein
LPVGRKGTHASEESAKHTQDPPQAIPGDSLEISGSQLKSRSWHVARQQVGYYWVAGGSKIACNFTNPPGNPIHSYLILDRKYTLNPPQRMKPARRLHEIARRLQDGPVNCKRLSANCKVPPVNAFLSSYIGRGEGTALRAEVGIPSVTSHQLPRIVVARLTYPIEGRGGSGVWEEVFGFGVANLAGS